MFQFTIRHGDERFTRRPRGKRRPQWRWPDLATHERTLRSTGYERHRERRPDRVRRTPGPIQKNCVATGSGFARRAKKPALLDQPAFNRFRLKAEKLIDSKVLEQLIRVQVDAGCSNGWL